MTQKSLTNASRCHAIMFLFIIYNPTQIGSLNIDETNRLASVYVILIIVSHRHHWQHLVSARIVFEDDTHHAILRLFCNKLKTCPNTPNETHGNNWLIFAVIDRGFQSSQTLALVIYFSFPWAVQHAVNIVLAFSIFLDIVVCYFRHVVYCRTEHAYWRGILTT